ncbi:Uncharacterized protein SCF082_LOCUS25548 [Durusdinium trenchii]|uniref:Kinetochore protein Spc24 n=1 Tax=Durusdinium trenchii TaxID=1381693 RepID=A0ABP0M118_9DINO
MAQTSSRTLRHKALRVLHDASQHEVSQLQKQIAELDQDSNKVPRLKNDQKALTNRQNLLQERMADLDTETLALAETAKALAGEELLDLRDLRAENDRGVMAMEYLGHELKTPRNSFYTWVTEGLPKGVAGPPTFRSHARHVIKLQDFLEEVRHCPQEFEVGIGKVHASVRLCWRRISSSGSLRC